MAEVVDAEMKEKLKAALWFAIGKIVDEETRRLNTTATPQFIGMLTEMTWTQIENAAIDLHTFAHHASRSTISTDDVLLLTRRNEALEGIIREFVDENKSATKAVPSRVSSSGKKASGVSVGRAEKNGTAKGKGKGKAKAK